MIDEWARVQKMRKERHPLITGGRSQHSRGLEPEPWQFVPHGSCKGEASRRKAYKGGDR